MGEFISQAEPQILKSIELPEYLGLQRLKSGKVRERYLISGGNLVLITTDRISAFDMVLGHIPYKGQVLNLLSEFWFDQTEDIIPNHKLAVPDPNVMIVKKAEPVPVEVVVRGYMSGVTITSIWGSYQRGERTIYGIPFRDGYRKGDKLDEPIITPTSKALTGHDERLTEREIIEKGIVDKDVWQIIREAALATFKRGQEISEQQGFLLLDTKMEFGFDENGKPILVDELFTPDSSRFVVSDNYLERLGKGEELDHYDKEYFRLAYQRDLGFSGEGLIPRMPLNLKDELSRRYITLFEGLTGKPFEIYQEPIEERIVNNLESWFTGR